MELSFFGEMAWKSALISGAALALAYVLRSRAAADRALVLRLGVAMLLLLPFIALALPALPIEAWAAPEPAALRRSTCLRAGPELPLRLTLAEPALQAAAAPTIWDDPTPLVLLAYLGGLLMAGGAAARRPVHARPLDPRRARRSTAPNGWPRSSGPAGRRRTASGCGCWSPTAVPSPLSWGWRNPVILIDPDTLAEPDEADAILAHEMAHVARRDWPVLMLTRLAAALFWFNPLVWLLEREVVQQAEEAADCEAAARGRAGALRPDPAQPGAGQRPADPGQSASRRPAARSRAGSRRSSTGGCASGRRARPGPRSPRCSASPSPAPVAAMQLVQAARAQEAPEAPAASRLRRDASPRRRRRARPARRRRRAGAADRRPSRSPTSRRS